MKKKKTFTLKEQDEKYEGQIAEQGKSYILKLRQSRWGPGICVPDISHLMHYERDCQADGLGGKAPPNDSISTFKLPYHYYEMILLSPYIVPNHLSF